MVIILLWASKFAMTKIECSFEMGKLTPLRVLFNLSLAAHEILYIFITT